MTLAVTGATGFVGRAVLAAAAGASIRALARRAHADHPGTEWIAGDLADTAALHRLCDGASAVVHIAGAVNAPDRAGFDLANVAGTAAILAAAKGAGVRRFVHISSQAAREPGLSMYGASKAAAEALVAASGLDWVIVRPPGVYGPGDREMLDIYRLAARGWALVPGRGRFSLMHADDLARALLALAHGGPSRVTVEIDDGAGAATNGYDHAGFARAVGVAVGRPVRLVPVPAVGLGAAAAVATALAWMEDQRPRLTFDRARYLAHPDWVAKGGNAAIAGVWQPRTALAEGLADTVAGYRAKGWL